MHRAFAIALSLIAVGCQDQKSATPWNVQEPQTVPGATEPAAPVPEPQNNAEVVYTEADFDPAIDPDSETERTIFLSISSWMEMIYLTDGFDDERIKEVMTFFHHPEPGSTFWLHILDDELLGYPAVFECATRAPNGYWDLGNGDFATCAVGGLQIWFGDPNDPRLQKQFVGEDGYSVVLSIEQNTPGVEIVFDSQADFRFGITRLSVRRPQ
ncbi:MAG: hypothetical protein R3E66_17490 [bacterium]